MGGICRNLVVVFEGNQRETTIVFLFVGYGYLVVFFVVVFKGTTNLENQHVGGGPIQIASMRFGFPNDLFFRKTACLTCRLLGAFRLGLGLDRFYPAGPDRHFQGNLVASSFLWF